MQLSIGMIVKNEEKYLDRCLAAIKPILDSINSELIIADTGSTDSTVEIAKKYTDNVFHFEWINDFAAARNSTLDRAKGEWYMFLDADEIFKSCNDIIHFFKSGEYKKYRSARYTIRNYDNSDMKHYSDVLSPRMIRMDGTRFEYAVHETFQNFQAPTKILDDIADHFGYISDGDLQKRKSERNTKLLEERLKSEPNPPALLYLQLYQSYNLYIDEKADYYMDIGMKKCRELKNYTVLIAFYGEKAASYFRKNKWDEIIEIAEEYFNLPEDIKPGTLGTDAEMHLLRAVAFKALRRNDEAITDYLEFFRIYKSIENGKLQSPDMLVYCFAVAVRHNLANALIELLECCIETKKYQIAAQNLKIVKIPELYDRPNIKELMREEFLVMTNTGTYNRAGQLYEQLNDEGRLLLQAFVHVAHDCVLADRVTISNHTALSGHCQVGPGAVISGYVLIHQFTRIGALAMIGPTCMIGQDIPPFCMLRENNYITGPNTIGLRRAGFSNETRLAIRHAIKTFFFEGLNAKNAIAAIESDVKIKDLSEIRTFCEFIKESKRGIMPGNPKFVGLPDDQRDELDTRA